MSSSELLWLPAGLCSSAPIDANAVGQAPERKPSDDEQYGNAIMHRDLNSFRLCSARVEAHSQKKDKGAQGSGENVNEMSNAIYDAGWTG